MVVQVQRLFHLVVGQGVVLLCQFESLSTLMEKAALEAVMGEVDDAACTDTYLRTMGRLCIEYGDALRAYYSAREQGNPEVVARLELVVIEKSNVMRACMERYTGGAGTDLH